MESNILLKKPFLEDVCKFTLPIKSQWKAIGIELWVIAGCRPLPDMSIDTIPSYRKSLLLHLKNFKTSSDDGQNLEEMFSKWINKSIYSEVSWNHLIQVLNEKLKLLDVVNKIEEFLKSEKAVKKYENVEVFEMPTMKTVYEFLHHGHKKDYSKFLRQYGYIVVPKMSSRYMHEESELELLVLVLFHPLNNDAIKWEDIVDALDSYKYYDIIGKIIAYLKTKGSCSFEKFMKVDYKVVTLNDAMKVLRPKQKEWYAIGKELEVDTEYRQQLVEQDDLSSENKLEVILRKWLELRSSPCYWSELKSIINDKLKWLEVVSSIYEVIEPTDHEIENCSAGKTETLTVQETSPSNKPKREINADSVSLNLVDVLDSVVEVTDWSSLGLALGLPYHDMERIKRDGYDEKDRLTRMVSMWLESGINTSWEGLVEALRRPSVDQIALASRIAEKYL